MYPRIRDSIIYQCKVPLDASIRLNFAGYFFLEVLFLQHTTLHYIVFLTILPSRHRHLDVVYINFHIDIQA